MSRIKVGRHALAWSIFVALAGMSATALAQEASASPQTPDGGDSITTLGATVVTAQKREEALQDVPITMEVVPKQLLKDAGIHDIKDLQILVPGLSVTSTGNEAQTTARIRGVGTVGDNPGLESSVGVVIDGVYRPRTGVGFSDLGQLERIEVLKGPQGTVFGKNTSAGLINIVTQAPTNERSTEAEVTVGNYGAVGVSASYNDRVGDNSAFRIYAAKRERDGFTDVNTGVGPRTQTDDSDQDFESVRGQLMLRPNDIGRCPHHCRLHPSRRELLRRRDHGARSDRRHRQCTQRRQRRDCGGRPGTAPGLCQSRHQPGHQGQGCLSRSQLADLLARRCHADLDHLAARLGCAQRYRHRLQRRGHPLSRRRRRYRLGQVRHLQSGAAPDRRNATHGLDVRPLLRRRGSRAQRIDDDGFRLRTVSVDRADQQCRQPLPGRPGQHRQSGGVPVRGRRAAVRHDLRRPGFARPLQAECKEPGPVHQ